MPIRLLPNGAIEADTDDELIGFLKKARVQSVKLPEQPLEADASEAVPAAASDSSPAHSKKTAWDHLLADDLDADGPWDRFSKLIWGKQLEVLVVLKSAGKPLEIADIRKAVGASTNNSVTGYIAGGIRKNLEKAKVPIEDVLVVDDTGGVRTYRAGPLLLANNLPEPEPEAT